MIWPASIQLLANHHLDMLTITLDPGNMLGGTLTRYAYVTAAEVLITLENWTVRRTWLGH